MALRRSNDAIQWYLNNLTSQVVAKSGIPTDRFHLGKIILQNFKDAPDFINLIDGATGHSATNETMLKKSVQCAISMRHLGLQNGDVMVLMAPTHIELSVPFFAAFYLGIIIAPIDRTFGVAEIEKAFSAVKPNIIFCQTDKVSDIKKALNTINHESVIVTFDTGDTDVIKFADFLKQYEDKTAVEDFQPNDFDAEDCIGLLVPTSGSTGIPKYAAITYKNFLIQAPQIWTRSTKFPTPTKIALIFSPIQWMSAILNFVLSALLRFTLLQTTLAITNEHIVYLINTYKPTYILCTPTLFTTLLRSADREKCDFSSFETVMFGGSAVTQDFINEVKTVMPAADIINIYGMTELCGPCFDFDYSVSGSTGKLMRTLQYRLINTETNEDIDKPHIPGELWVKGPPVIKEYYKDPMATQEAFADGGWFKSGDIFYRDEHWNFFFVDRLKILLKYKSHQISPLEIENVIRQHPNVQDVAVTGIPDPESGDLPIAFIVPHKGCKITEQEIKKIVADSLTDSKQLRGGVIFIDKLPLNPSTKVHRTKLKEMARSMKKSLS